jgi:hypothetical protein
VDPAALPGGPDEDLGDGGLQSEVVVGDDQLALIVHENSAIPRKAIDRAA